MTFLRTSILLLLLSLVARQSVCIPQTSSPSSNILWGFIRRLHTSSRSSLGHAYDSCKKTSDCHSHLKCLHRAYGTDCCGRNCACIPKSPTTCKSNSDCPSGEVCVMSWDFPLTCISNVRVQLTNKEQPGRFRGPGVASTAGLPDLVPTCSTPSPAVAKTKLGFDVGCVPGSCKGDRVCAMYHFGLHTSRPDYLPACCDGVNKRCFCLSKQATSCKSSANCLDGEVCAAGISPPMCYSIAYLNGLPTLEYEVLGDVANGTPAPGGNQIENNDSAGCGSTRVARRTSKSSRRASKWEQLVSDLERGIIGVGHLGGYQQWSRTP